MKLVSYQTEDREHLGVFVDGHIYNLNSCHKLIPDSMSEFLSGGEPLMELAKKIDKEIYSNESEAGYVHKMDMDRLKEHNPIQYEMIRIVYTNKLSEKGNDLDQNGNGTWASYYIVSKDQADSDWKVFDLYGLTSHDNN